jgi:hypothetical protein
MADAGISTSFATNALRRRGKRAKARSMLVVWCTDSHFNQASHPPT